MESDYPEELDQSVEPASSENPMLLRSVSSRLDMEEILSAIPPKTTADRLVSRYFTSIDPSVGMSPLNSLQLRCLTRAFSTSSYTNFPGRGIMSLKAADCAFVNVLLAVFGFLEESGSAPSAMDKSALWNPVHGDISLSPLARRSPRGIRQS
jgi:hypothetical protein